MWTLRRACALFACLASLAGCYAAFRQKIGPRALSRGCIDQPLRFRWRFCMSPAAPAQLASLSSKCLMAPTSLYRPLRFIPLRRTWRFVQLLRGRLAQHVVCRQRTSKWHDNRSFPAGAATPSMSCTVAYVTQRIAVHNGTLLHARARIQDQQYALPLSGPELPAAGQVLVDRYALLRGGVQSESSGSLWMRTIMSTTRGKPPEKARGGSIAFEQDRRCFLALCDRRKDLLRFDCANRLPRPPHYERRRLCLEQLQRHRRVPQGLK